MGSSGSVSASTNAAPEPVKKNHPDLKQVFDEETRKFNSDSAAFDPVKVEKQIARQQIQKKRWGKTETTFIVVFAIGIAVLVVLLVKYVKTCAETTTPNCNIGTDENCYCERYVEDNARPAGAR